MMQILLKNIQLFGYHGVHPVEKIIGTNFTIDLIIHTSISTYNLNLNDTIDYEAVFRLIQEEWLQKEDLLENLSNRIIQKIFTTFTKAEKIELTILKIDAPISGFNGQVGIRNCKSREEFVY